MIELFLSSTIDYVYWYRGREPAGPAGVGATLVGVGEMLDVLQSAIPGSAMANSGAPEGSVLPAFLCGTMSINKHKYLTPSQSTRSDQVITQLTDMVYCRPQTYSDALKYSFCPRTIPHWKSLAPSVVPAETTEEFRALI